MVCHNGIQFDRDYRLKFKVITQTYNDYHLADLTIVNDIQQL